MGGTRLSLIVALAALVLALPAPSTLARLAYTGNWGEGTVSVIDTATNQTTAIDLEGEARTIAISPEGRTAYVTLVDDSVVQPVDLRTNELAGEPIQVGTDVWAIAFTPDGRFAYASDRATNAIRVIDTRTLQVLGAPIAVGEAPVNVVFTPDGETAFVPDEVEGNVRVIDTGTRQVVATVPVTPGEEVWGIAVTPDGSKVYVSAADAGGVYVIDTEARQVVDGPITTGAEPYEIAITPNGRTAYVASFAGNSIAAIDTQTNQVTTTIEATGNPWQIAIVPNQSPLASFTARPSEATTEVKFDGAASTDPDGTVSIFDWDFGDGTLAANAGPTPSHTYRSGGRFAATLTVIDDEGCSRARVFTGRTAYCSGSALAARAQAITVAPNRFRFAELVRNPGKGTARLRVEVHAAGELVLSGKRVVETHRSVNEAGTIDLEIKAKAKLRKTLRNKHHARTGILVTFHPTGGAPHSEERPVGLVLR